MSDIVIGVIATICAIGFMALGTGIKQSNVEQDCATLHQFRINDKVYVCEEKK